MLEDLIVAAFNNAKQNAEQCSNEEMSKMGISPDLLKGVM
jgi:DNA-binding protein YbaB